MEIRKTVGLITLGIALTTASSWAQTTPTGTATSTTYPQGAIAPDSMPMGTKQNQKKAMKRNRRNNKSTTNTSVQDARYRESSSSDGTSINNSNTTNYNSNNVTNAPTGAGSNPNVLTDTTKSKKPD